jgi:hypothetical protein
MPRAGWLQDEFDRLDAQRFHVTTRKDTTMPVWTKADIDALIRTTRHTVDSLKAPFDHEKTMIPGADAALHEAAEFYLSLAILAVAFTFLSGATIGENEAVLLQDLLKEFHKSSYLPVEEVIRRPDLVKHLMSYFDQLPSLIVILEMHDQQRWDYLCRTGSFNASRDCERHGEGGRTNHRPRTRAAPRIQDAIVDIAASDLSSHPGRPWGRLEAGSGAVGHPSRATC